MAIYWIKPTTFAEVEAIYNNTKPMRGRNKGKDVRPIGDRARDHERVKKISANCYLLMNGGYYDDVFQWYYFRGKPAAPTQTEMVALAPICWKRHKDGTETITVRNGIGNGAHMSHYSFLDRMLPRGMTFGVVNGKQYVGASSGEYYLPKCMYVPRHIIDQERSRYDSWMRATDDGSSLTFKRGEHGFTLVGDARDAPKPPRVVVKKGQKARYKQAITDFREWVFAIGPMLDVNWERNRIIRAEMDEYLKDTHGVYVGFNGVDIPANIAIQIITNYNNPMRLHMAYNFVYHSNIKHVQTEEDVKHVKAQFNRWINKTCGFTKTVKG